MEQFTKHELKIFNGFISAPEMKYFESGTCTAKFSIPLKASKEAEPVWLNCEAWGTVAEKIGELEKGTNLTVIGKFKTEEYQGKTYTKFNVVTAKA
jgi:single-stranded DNA-binding protein